MPQTGRYTVVEIEFIKCNYDKLSVDDIASTLNRSAKAVRGKIERLRLPLSELSRNASYGWSESETNFIKENYLTMSDEKISKVLGLSESIVCRKRLDLGLRIHHCEQYTQGGYIMQYIDKKKVWIHRRNAEIKVGHSLVSTEKVHHVDGNKINNDSDNLYVCSDRSDHRKVHGSLERVAFELIRRGTIKFNHDIGEYYL